MKKLKVDIREVLRTYGVPFVEHGEEGNVVRGNVNVKCPMCGADDHSHHMGINLETGVFGCWRNREHRGRNPEYLLSKLTGRPVREMRELLHDTTTTTIEGLSGLSKRLESLKEGNVLQVQEPDVFVELPRDFATLRATTKGVMRIPYVYLRGRGFSNEDIARMGGEFGVGYSHLLNRVVFPFNDGEELIGWTSRAVGESRAKYMHHPPGPTIKQTLFNYDHTIKRLEDSPDDCTAVFVVEGVFDALRLELCCPGVYGVACLGVSATPAQVEKIRALASRAPLVCISFDKKATRSARTLADSVPASNVRMVMPPDIDGDIGDLKPAQAVAYVEKFQES